MEYDLHVPEKFNPSEWHRATFAVNSELPGIPTIDLKKLVLDRYKKNPVVLFGHDDHNLPIGFTRKIEVDERGALVAEFGFLRNDKRAAIVENAWKQGVTGASIGVTRDRNNPILREWSIVTIPADPDAVSGAQRKALENLQTIFMSEENKETTIERIDVEAKITDSRDEEIADLKRQLESANMSLLKTKYRPLLGVDTDITTRREVFVSAIGDQGPEDMDSRSDEYLESWADQLLVRSSNTQVRV